MAVQARGRDERGQTLDQFQGREPQLGAYEVGATDLISKPTTWGAGHRVRA
jgi:hypothetical protein